MIYLVELENRVIVAAFQRLAQQLPRRQSVQALRLQHVKDEYSQRLISLNQNHVRGRRLAEVAEPPLQPSEIMFLERTLSRRDGSHLKALEGLRL